jgi:CheY-like chemotaxis protein
MEEGGEASDSPEVLRGVRVLIVDANEVNRSILHQQAAQWGMQPHLAENGYQALNMLQSALERGEPFDVTIIDVNMPGMDGIELMRRIRAIPGLAALRMATLSSVGLLMDPEVSESVGIIACMTKPVKPRELLECLISVLSVRDPSCDVEPGKRDVPAVEPGLINIEVLLVEDNPVNQEVAKATLENLGCRVDTASDGRRALDAVSLHTYDLVLMDCQMPVMDGYETTRQIREGEKNAGSKRRRIPIIALTAHAMQGDREECIAAGMDDYLTKPFTREQLMSVLKKWAGVAAGGVGRGVRGEDGVENSQSLSEIEGVNASGNR